MNIIVQARMSSVRLPKKMSIKVNNYSILEHVINRISLINKNKKIFIATSIKKEDDEIEEITKKYDVILFRGNLMNVYKRYYDLINEYDLDHFIRISGDSPLIDYEIIKKCYEIYSKNNYDIVTNKSPRSFPIGQTVEVINANKFIDSKKYVTTEYLEEHVTIQMYENNYKYFNHVFKKDYSKLNLSIDNQNNLKKFNKFINFNKNNNLKLEDIINFYEKN